MHYFRRSFPVLALATLIVLAGCDAFGGDEHNGDSSNADVLMPLAVGNTWTFEQEGEGNTFQLEVTRTVEHDGETYAVIAESGGEAPDGEENTAIRNTDEGAYFAEFFANQNSPVQEMLFFRYPAEDGETYQFGSTSFEVEQGEIETPAGTFTAYTYRYEDPGEQLSLSFAPGVGPVRVQGNVELSSYDIE